MEEDEVCFFPWQYRDIIALTVRFSRSIFEILLLIEITCLCLR